MSTDEKNDLIEVLKKEFAKQVVKIIVWVILTGIIVAVGFYYKTSSAQEMQKQEIEQIKRDLDQKVDMKTFMQVITVNNNDHTEIKGDLKTIQTDIKDLLKHNGK